MVIEYRLEWLGEGSGTREDPYIIKDSATLARIQVEQSAHYVIVRDIDMTGVAWEPAHFSGELNGRGFTISGLFVDKSAGGHAGALVNNLTGYIHDLNLNGTIIGNEAYYNGLLCSFFYGRAQRICLSGTVDNGGDRGGALTGYMSTLEGYMVECVSLVNFSAIPGSRSGHTAGWTSQACHVSNFVFTDDLSNYGVNVNGGGDTLQTYSSPGLTLAQLADPANYPQMFDFVSTWEIVDGLPRLRPHPIPGTHFQTTDNPQSSRVSGTIQVDSAPAKRTVRAFGYFPTTHTIDDESISLSKSLGDAVSDPETGEYTIDLLKGYGKAIFVVAFDDYGADFAPDLAVAVGDRVHPTTPNGHVWECTGAGTLPTAEPTWIVDTETAQLYGTASMIAKPFYRPMVHGPVIPEVIEPAPEP